MSAPGCGPAGVRGHEPAPRRHRCAATVVATRRDALVELEGRGRLEQRIGGGIVVGIEPSTGVIGSSGR